MLIPKIVWTCWIGFTLASFAVLEIMGYLSSPWGTLTDFIRYEEGYFSVIKWILMIGFEILIVHLVGDWP